MTRMIRMWLALLAATAVSTVAVASDLTTADQRRQEIVILRREYIDLAPSFDRAAKTRARTMLTRIAKDAARLNDQEYLLRLAEVAAQADNGHDSIGIGNSPLRPAVRVPVKMLWFEDRLFISRVAPANADLAGAEVLRLGRWTPMQLAAHLRSYQGGKEDYRRHSLTWLVHNPAMLVAIGATPSADKTRIEARRADGSILTRDLQTLTAKETPASPFPTGWWSPALSTDERAKAWQVPKISAPWPLYLQEPQRFFRMVEIPELGSLYVQFRANFDQGDEKIAPFVEKVEQRLAGNPPRNLILDLRFDTGGDNTRNRDLMRAIAQKVSGRIFVLASSYTFSAGIATEAAMIHDGRSKVTVIGEEPGDRTHWWSEQEELCLPFSKVCVNRQLGHWDLVHGCARTSHCYSDQFDLRIDSLVPEVRAPITAADWLGGRDPGMAAVAQQLGRRD